MHNALQDSAAVRSHAPDVLLEFGDGQWFVAVRSAVALPPFTHEQRAPGYASYLQAVDAAIGYAADHDLTVDTRDNMIEQVIDTLRWFEADKAAFVA